MRINYELCINLPCTWNVAVSVAGAVAKYLEVSTFSAVGNRLTNRLRCRYVAALLRQEVAYFETGASTGAGCVQYVLYLDLLVFPGSSTQSSLQMAPVPRYQLC